MFDYQKYLDRFFYCLSSSNHWGEIDISFQRTGYPFDSAALKKKKIDSMDQLLSNGL